MAEAERFRRPRRANFLKGLPGLHGKSQSEETEAGQLGAPPSAGGPAVSWRPSVPVLGPSQRSAVAPFDLCCLFMQKLLPLFPGLADLTNPHAWEEEEEEEEREQRLR